MKKLLLVTPFVPSSRTAGQNYTLRLLDRLSDLYSVDVCLFHYPKEAVPAVFGKAKVIRSFTTSSARMIACALKIPFVHPIFSSRFRFDLLRFILRSRAHYDYYYFNCSQTFIYSLFVPNKASFLMAQDVVTQLFGRRKGLVNRFGAGLCKLSEKLIIKHSRGRALCFSTKDKDLISSLSGKSATVVDFIIDDRIREIDYRKVSLQKQLCLYGAWHRRENSQGLEWFLDNVLPLANRALQFVVVGGGLSREIMDRIDGLPNIKYLGFVENPYAVLAESQALLAPLFEGAGVKVKVVEALACGTPVIGSSVALEGIDFAEELPVFQCTSPEEYLKAMGQVMPFTSEDMALFKTRFASVYPRTTFEQILSDFD